MSLLSTRPKISPSDLVTTLLQWNNMSTKLLLSLILSDEKGISRRGGGNECQTEGREDVEIFAGDRIKAIVVRCGRCSAERK
jgi:hypothetical protein